MQMFVFKSVVRSDPPAMYLDLDRSHLYVRHSSADPYPPSLRQCEVLDHTAVDLELNTAE